MGGRKPPREQEVSARVHLFSSISFTEIKGGRGTESFVYLGLSLRCLLVTVASNPAARIKNFSLVL